MTSPTIRSFDNALVREFLEVMLPEQGALGVFGALHAAAVPTEVFVELEDGAYAVGAAEVVAVAYGQSTPAFEAAVPGPVRDGVHAIAAEVRDLPNVRALALSVVLRVQQPNCGLAHEWMADTGWTTVLGDLKSRLEACA